MKCIKCGGDSFYFSNWQDERDQINFRCSHCLTINQKAPELPIDFVDADELPEFDRECKAIVYFKYNSSCYNPEEQLIAYFQALENMGIICIMDVELK